MSRLNIERQKELEPKRVDSTKKELLRLGFEILDSDEKKIIFSSPEGNKITFYPYSGWHSGKGIKDGRGFENLLKQLNFQLKKQREMYIEGEQIK